MVVGCSLFVVGFSRLLTTTNNSLPLYSRLIEPMGKLLILANYVFLIYGSDIYEKRRHVHVTYNHRGFKRACKFWLEPEIEIDLGKVGDFKE